MTWSVAKRSVQQSKPTKGRRLNGLIAVVTTTCAALSNPGVSFDADSVRDLVGAPEATQEASSSTQEASKESFNGENAFLIIVKNDAVEAEFKAPDIEQWKEHYAEHNGKCFFDDLVDRVKDRKVALAIFRQDGSNHAEVVKRARNLTGVTNPADAAPGSIRGKYGKSKEYNAVHCSDSPESAIKEMKLWFPKLFKN